MLLSSDKLGHAVIYDVAFLVVIKREIDASDTDHAARQACAMMLEANSADPDSVRVLSIIRRDVPRLPPPVAERAAA